MTTRSKFLKSEIRKILDLLNVSYEHAGLDDDERFKKIFELLMEISEKSTTIRQLLNGSYFI